MDKLQVGDRARVKDRPKWPGGYKIAGWEGSIVEIKDDPQGFVIMLADNSGYQMSFVETELEKI
jgi:hypothetical protein